MPGELYDTCVFIDYWRGDQSAVSLIEVVRQKQSLASYSVISVTELWQYNQLGRQEEIELIALTRFFLQEAVLTGSVARRAGEWIRPYSRNRRRRLIADALIAATAEERNETIRTRNYRDIRRFYTNFQPY